MGEVKYKLGLLRLWLENSQGLYVSILFDDFLGRYEIHRRDDTVYVFKEGLPNQEDELEVSYTRQDGLEEVFIDSVFNSLVAVLFLDIDHYKINIFEEV